MKALILSAGLGTRMREVSELPKVLIPIAGKPMIVWNIELCKRYGITDIAVNTHYKGLEIMDYLRDGRQFGVKMRYRYEPSLLGTSGSLNNFRDFFNETFVVIYGDIISQLNINKMLEFHKKNEALATLVVQKTNRPDIDIVQMDGDKVVGFGGSRDWGNSAFYILEPQVFDYLPEGESDFIKDVFPKMERVYGYKTDEFIEDAGTPERLAKVEEHLKRRAEVI